MPFTRGASTQWPSVAQRNVDGTLEYATSARDSMGGSTAPTWTYFGAWKVASSSVPVVVSETEATSVYVIEGPWRRDLWDHKQAGKTIRFLIPAWGLALKILELDNPQFRNITLKATCARMVGVA